MRRRGAQPLVVTCNRGESEPYKLQVYSAFAVVLESEVNSVCRTQDDRLEIHSQVIHKAGKQRQSRVITITSDNICHIKYSTGRPP